MTTIRHGIISLFLIQVATWSPARAGTATQFSTTKPYRGNATLWLTAAVHIDLVHIAQIPGEEADTISL